MSIFANPLVLGAVFTAGAGIVAAFVSLYGALRANKAASFSKHIELGVTELIDQLQEERQILQAEVVGLRAECSELRTEVRQLREQIVLFQKMVVDKDAEIVRLRKAAEHHD